MSTTPEPAPTAEALSNALLDALGDAIVAPKAEAKAAHEKLDRVLVGFKIDAKTVLTLLTIAINSANGSIRQLIDRVKELETRPKGLEYCGPYQRAMVYKRHQGVTHQGSIWECVVDETREAPGDGSKAWQLAVKAGRDGKDLR